MKFEVGKFYKTRDGRKVKIYDTNGHPQFPIHGATFTDNSWMSSCWRESGMYTYHGRSPDDIVSEWVEEEEKTVWINIYNPTNDYGYTHPTRESADREASCDRIACVPVTIKFKKGDGL